MQVEHCDLLVAGSGAGGLSTAVVAASTRHSTTCATSSVMDATSLWYALFLKTHRTW